MSRPRPVRGMGRLFRRPNSQMVWISYYVRGKEIRESSSSNQRSKARDLLKQRLGEISNNTHVGRNERRVRFEDLAVGYLNHYKRTGLRSGETAAYRVQNLKRFFGPDRAIDITTARLIAYQDFRLTEKAQGATVNRELAALARMFSLARKAGLVSRAAIPEFPDPLKENPPRQGFFEHPAYLAVWQALGDDDYRDALDFGYWSGWRKNKEVRALPWRMVDLRANELRLSPEFSKTDKGRVIPIPHPLRAILLRRLAKRRLDCPLVFHKDGRPLGDWRKTWASACIKAGFFHVVRDEAGNERKKPDLMYHDLRRTAVRNLDRARVRRHVAKQLVGHKTDDIYDRYNIESRRALEEAGKLYAAYMASLPTTTDKVAASGRSKRTLGANTDSSRTVGGLGAGRRARK